jgi:subtilase family serine protease
MKTTLQNGRRLLAASLIVGLTACGGGGGSRSTPVIPGGANNTSTSSALVSTLVPNANLAKATQAGPATGIDTIVMHVVVTMKDARGLVDYARGANDPSDARYRQWLTATQIGDRFGASPSDYKTVANYFAGYGLKAGGFKARLGLTVAGSQTAFENALGTKFVAYRAPDGRAMFGPSASIHFSTPLPVSSIDNAVADPSRFKRAFVRGTGGQNTGGVTGNTPQQVATAFDFTGAYSAGYTGAGINLGIIGTGPILQHDFSQFKTLFGFNGAATLTQVNAQTHAASDTGGSPTATPPATTGPCNGPLPGCNPEDGEAQIDTEQAALAKDANILFYLAYVPKECNTPGTATCAPSPGLGIPLIGLSEDDDSLQQAIDDNDTGSNGPDILSLSYGGSELGYGAFVATNPLGGWDPSALKPSEFAALTAEGVAVFVSSGDAGAEECARPRVPGQINSLCVSYPSGDPNVTSVGGVTVPINNAGQLMGPITVWGEQTGAGGGGASGGGISLFIPRPSWQKGVGIDSVTGTNRLQPDVSLLGDPLTGVATVVNADFGQSILRFGGTSVAAPEMAAMWALVLQACKNSASCAGRGAGSRPFRLGSAAPYFYSAYNTPAKYASAFYDVTFGINGVVGCAQQAPFCPPGPLPTPGPGYDASLGTGYDMSTGIGVPFARHLIQAVVGV